MKTILITGASDGIGKQTALELARMGHCVWLHGRNAFKTQQALDDLRAAAGNANLNMLVADFASLAQVRHLAEQVLARIPQLDVLINNVGVWMNERTLTPDGYETTFQVNHLAPFLLTELLRPLLARNAPARVVTVASQLHKRSQLHLDDLQLERDFSGYNAYTQSKICNVLFAYALANQLRGTGVTSNALHPGVITTKLLWTGFNSTAANIAEGAKTSVYAATAPELANVTGKYFEPVQGVPTLMASSDLTCDVATQTRLWQISTHLLGLA